jgi:hypothetical protein
VQAALGSHLQFLVPPFSMVEVAVVEEAVLAQVQLVARAGGKVAVERALHTTVSH